MTICALRAAVHPTPLLMDGRSHIMLWTILIILVIIALALFIFSRLRGRRSGL
jgi:hypothetical protein